MTGQDEKILTLIKTLTRDKFWGSIQLNFKNGVLVTIRKEETLDPEKLVR